MPPDYKQKHHYGRWDFVSAVSWFRLRRFPPLVTAVVIMMLAAQTAAAADFRLYNANKRLQQRRVGELANSERPGCHNLLIKRRIYRVAQVGFLHCTVYAEKDCAEGTELPVRWKDEERAVTKLTPGARWFLDGKRGSKMGSWQCEPKE